MQQAAVPVCFAHRRCTIEAAVAIDTTGLPPDMAQALADTLPFLRCGEESAVHAFGRRLAGRADGANQRVLDAITADETRHAAWLEALAAALPPASAVPNGDAMAAFFRRLLTRDAALHFARVAALDLAVCALLRPLAARGSALACAPQVHAGLRAIRSDEARHVRVARDCAGALGFGAAQQRRLDLDLRTELLALLAPVRSSLERLGIRALAGAPHG